MHTIHACSRVSRRQRYACQRLRTLSTRLIFKSLAICFLLAAEAVHAATPVPMGPYLESCRNASMNGTTLRAECKDFFGIWKNASLENAASCSAIGLWNVNGALRCVKSSTNLDGTSYDILSISSDVVKDGKETKVWRIDQPNVRKETTTFPQIQFKPGDRVSFSAGGCAQTGGSGPTWKSYVWPYGPEAPTRYSGTVSLEGVTGSSGRRIGGVMSCQPYVVPRPQPGKTNPTLVLGYEDDDYSDNGYWGHDNGTADQCKGVGPAWVEVTVVSGGTPPLAGTRSPHCKPFDLTWDVAGEDFNGLPVNPAWDWQLRPGNGGKKPDFVALCQGAFPPNDPITKTWPRGLEKGVEGTFIDNSVLAQQCTSQSPTLDLHWALGAACSGWPLQGHLNWMIATYTGVLTWDELASWYFGAWDEDYNWHLQTQSNFGVALGDPKQPATALALEADAQETINNMGSPFWQQAQGQIMSGGGRTSKGTGILSTMFNGPSGTGSFAVVTGLIGLDAEHGAYTEVHPVLSMALLTEDKAVSDTVVRQHWAFFLRNSGNEGGCASAGQHFWDSPGGDYFIELPWPKGATGIKGQIQNIDVSQWIQTKTSVSFMQTNNATIVKVRPADAKNTFGVDGEFTVEYTVPAAGHHKAVTGGTRPKHFDREGEDGEHSMAEKITDAGVRAKFIAAASSLPEVAAQKPSKLHVEPTVPFIKRVPKAASRGEVTHTRVVPDPVRQQRDAKVIEILKTYQNELKVKAPEVPEKSTAPKKQPPWTQPASK
ncbi:MAG TPA: hypothetical protein VKZ53_27695 [Candidatus Angelobacter sp.]|nr:hypothetical protein [Candidatus Angelobacter sp.]